MKNNFCHLTDGTTVIYLNSKDGELEVLIDTNDFQLVDEYKGTWCPVWTVSTRSYRVAANIYFGTFNGNKKATREYLHRWIMKPDSSLDVDHINHNQLDNRRSNLRVVTRAQNQQNKKGAYRNNKSSGLRNVYFDKDLGKYKVAYRINGKQKHYGVYKTLEESAIAAKEMRKEIFPYSREV